jgi:large subunit ribosomal protein L32
MPVPKRKRSRARRDSRHANKGIKPQMVGGCKTCAAPLLPHQICKECGHYKGIKVLVTKAERAENRVAKKQAQQPSAHQEMSAAPQSEE